jgi:protein-glucosylgalactosylhydroxylysine glucosidase
MMNRRFFLKGAIGSLVSGAAAFAGNYVDNPGPAGSFVGSEVIDRPALVARHKIIFKTTDTLNVLSVGNGNFAFGADITGLQTFQDDYNRGIPLSTLSHWGWHNQLDPYGWRDCTYPETLLKNCCGREVPYLTALAPVGGRRQENRSDVGKISQLVQEARFLYAATTRLNLGRIGLILTHPDGSPAVLTDIKDPVQTLDLWTGLLKSRFTFDGQRVVVHTCCHGRSDQVAVRIESPLIKSGRLMVLFAFPYASNRWNGDGADWSQPNAYVTEMRHVENNRANFHCVLDATEYHAAVAWQHGSLTQSKPHYYMLKPQLECETLEFVEAYSPEHLPKMLPHFAATLSSAAEMWHDFWMSGGAIDLSGSQDPRWKELERRVVLSQYLTRINCCGTLPPQETGLTCNSWYGKFHLEMHWWHAAHFPLWGRSRLLERSLPFYERLLPAALARARGQGYVGARWPKSCGPSGDQAPSDIEACLIWQQPHQMAYAELCYQANPTRHTLNRYKDRVFATADFLASFACWSKKAGRYQLGPPVYDAAEIYHDFEQQWNPTFEVAYWHWGLGIAQKWRQRMGLSPKPMWERVRKYLPPLATNGGLYVAGEMARKTFTEVGRAVSHPCLLAPLGMLDGSMVNRNIMSRTLEKVLKVWDWNSTWGWDYPMTAMTAARLGQGEQAVDILLMSERKNSFLSNGHNYQTDILPVYLPGNGGLLYAVGLMAAGWPGAPSRSAPGFPDNGRWAVQHEGLWPAL